MPRPYSLPSSQRERTMFRFALDWITFREGCSGSVRTGDNWVAKNREQKGRRKNEEKGNKRKNVDRLYGVRSKSWECRYPRQHSRAFLEVKTFKATGSDRSPFKIDFPSREIARFFHENPIHGFQEGAKRAASVLEFLFPSDQSTPSVQWCKVFPEKTVIASGALHRSELCFFPCLTSVSVEVPWLTDETLRARSTCFL